MRVEDPILSIVAMRRRAFRRSGARMPSARQAPLNSSSSDRRGQKLGCNLEGVGVDHTRIHTGLDPNNHRLLHRNRPERSGAANAFGQIGIHPPGREIH